jgi:hypothetical protein
VNFLLDKVGDPYITSYVNHVSSAPNSRKAPHSIVPDIHARNFPVGRQTINDSGSTSTAEAFFEVKTFTACKTRYKHNNATIKPPDRRAREITLSYKRKFKKLDKLFAADIVGDGTGDVIGPFQQSQNRFWRGQVIPICAGWFGETNKDKQHLEMMESKYHPSSTLTEKEEHIPSCCNNSSEQLELQLYVVMQSSNFRDCIMFEPPQQKAEQTTAIKNGTHNKMEEQAGFLNTSPKDTELLNSSETDMTSVCAFIIFFVLNLHTYLYSGRQHDDLEGLKSSYS